ncbi:MAG: hypothetical protein JJU45_19185 [Acidimicrobiia bacterium]|nr:hypothetical protein [Acidimicrobiia bacterium]
MSGAQRRPRPPRPDDAGVVGGSEAIAFGVAVLLVGTLLGANLWATVDASVAASAAARQAVRAYVEAPDGATAREDAERAATDVVVTHGRSPSRLSLHIDHPDGRPWGRCVPVRVTVDYRLALATVPGLSAGPERTVRATSTERIDPWRSGLDAGVC